MSSALAQRRATDTALTPMFTGPATRPAISITLAPLPPHQAYRVDRITPTWWLITVRHGVECGELERAYREALRCPVRPLLYQAMLVPDPEVNPIGYLRQQWWHPDWRVDIDSIQILEDAHLIRRWPHAWLL